MSEPVIRYSNLVLYKDCKILSDRRFIVEGIESYLLQLTSLLVSNFQYLRNNIDLSIKIHKNEDFCEILATNNYNYLKVSQEGCNYYYFVVKKTQVATETIALDLRMDVLNTFTPDNQFSFSNLTKVTREHKDRYTSNIIATDCQTDMIEEGEDTIRYNLTTNFIDGDYTRFKISNIVLHDEQGNPSPLLYTYLILPVRIPGGGTNVYVVFNLNNYAQERLYFTFEAEFLTLRRKVDLYSEGINPKLYKKEIGRITAEDDVSWYLIYKNSTDQEKTPVDVFLAPSIPIDVISNEGGELSASDLTAGKTYLISSPYNGYSYETKVMLADDSSYETSFENNGRDSNYFCIALTKDDTRIKVEYLIYRKRDNSWSHSVISTSYSASVVILQNSDVLYWYVNATLPNQVIANPDILEEYNLTSSAITLKSISSLDKTDSKLIKVIALPYLPNNYQYDENNKLIIDSIWDYDSASGFLKLSSLDSVFENKMTTTYKDPVYEALYDTSKIPLSLSGSRLSFLDPKLYHSDYYLPKFVYDSFSFAFNIEKIGSQEYESEYFEFTFKMTSTIRSRFLFAFPNYQPEYSTEDYDNILNVNRNNEAVIYNSAYLTYLRTGYNIDVKAKERTQSTAILGGVLTTVGAIAGMGFGFATGPAMGVKSVISGGSSIASSIVSSINTIAQSEENLERKIATLKAQAISVEGSDDLDLLEYYSGNRAKLVLYKVSERVQTALNDLFYYTGYISDETKIPELDTRYWFNYLACELRIESTSSNIPDLCQDELKNLYSQGVIFLHKNNTNWDFELSKENWETSIIEAFE